MLNHNNTLTPRIHRMNIRNNKHVFLRSTRMSMQLRETHRRGDDEVLLSKLKQFVYSPQKEWSKKKTSPLAVILDSIMINSPADSISSSPSSQFRYNAINGRRGVVDRYADYRGAVKDDKDERPEPPNRTSSFLVKSTPTSGCASQG